MHLPNSDQVIILEAHPGQMRVGMGGLRLLLAPQVWRNAIWVWQYYFSQFLAVDVTPDLYRIRCSKRSTASTDHIQFFIDTFIETKVSIRKRVTEEN